MGKNFWKIILVIAVIIRIIYFFLIPPGQLPDEKYNLKRILTNASNPDSIFFPNKEEFYYPNNEYFYPPLYFLISSSIVKTAGPNLSFEKLISVLRFVSFIISILSLIFIWKILEKIISNKLIKLTSYTFIALLPSLGSISIAANPNNLAFFLVILFIYFTIKNYDKKNSFLAAFIAGSVFGLAVLTKTDSLAVLPFILYPLSTLRKQKNFLLIYLIVFLIASFVFGGWWYLANYFKIGYFYNQKLFEASILETIIPFSFKHYIYVLIYFTFLSFHATYGSTNNIYLNHLLYIPIVVLTLMSFFGLIEKVSSPSGTGKNKLLFYLPFFLSFIINLYFFFLMNFYYSLQAQGRYLFNSIIFLSLMWAAGLFYFLPKNIHKIIPVIILVVLFSLNILGFGCNLQYFYGKTIFPKILSCVGQYSPVGKIGSDTF
jgi:4-amino-4-deoxy-L-arabinose transferase-like glycosyltransferase